MDRNKKRPPALSIERRGCLLIVTTWLDNYWSSIHFGLRQLSKIRFGGQLQQPCD